MDYFRSDLWGHSLTGAAEIESQKDQRELVSAKKETQSLLITVRKKV